MKMKTLIKYEVWTALKPLCIYYGIVYAALLAMAIATTMIGVSENFSMSGIETSGFIYLGILGALGFQEDFKMLIQNGFTRKHIWKAALSMFAIITLVMSLVDTIMPLFMNQIVNFKSMYQNAYGNEFSFMIQWLWLFVVYLSIAFVSYMASLICNRVGAKKFWLVVLAIFMAFVFIVSPVVGFLLPEGVKEAMWVFLINITGFSKSGAIHIATPILMLVGLISCVSFLQYKLIQKTELKN